MVRAECDYLSARLADLAIRVEIEVETAAERMLNALRILGERHMQRCKWADCIGVS